MFGSPLFVSPHLGVLTAQDDAQAVLAAAGAGMAAALLEAPLMRFPIVCRKSCDKCRPRSFVVYFYTRTPKRHHLDSPLCKTRSGPSGAANAARGPAAVPCRRLRHGKTVIKQFLPSARNVVLICAWPKQQAEGSLIQRERTQSPVSGQAAMYSLLMTGGDPNSWDFLALSWTAGWFRARLYP